MIYYLSSEWRARFNQAIDARDAKSKEKHGKIIQEAKEALEKFYAEYNQKKERGIARNKELEKKEAEEDPNASIWEKAYKMVEKKDKKEKGSKDLSRS